MRKVVLIIGTFLISTLFSCTDSVVDNTLPDDKERQKQELKVYEAYSNVIDYKTARYLAYVELENGAAEFINLNGEYELSKFPRIVYDYDNLPKYYEFDAIVDNKIRSTITTHAKKEDKTVIAFMFEHKINTPIKEGYEIFAGQYPNVYYGIRGEINSTPKQLLEKDLQTPVAYAEAVEDIDNIWSSYYSLLNDMSEEERAIMLEDIETMKNSPEFIESQDKTEVNNFWSEMEILSNELQNYDDNEINRFMIKSSTLGATGPGYDGTTSTPTTHYIIPRYNNDNLKRTHWERFCGPAVIAWIYRGLYDHYPKNSTEENAYIKIHNDRYNSMIINNETAFRYCSDFSYYTFSDDALASIWNKKSNNISRQLDNGFYEEILSHTVKTGDTYPMYHLGLANAMKSLTNVEYGVQVTSTSRDYINNKHLPVIIMLGTGSSFHYLVAFGTGKTGKTNYIYVTDNGSYIGSYNYYPYWRKEGSNYGIRYKVVKK